MSEADPAPGTAVLEVAGEGRAPALVEDRLVCGLDGTVCLRSAGADPGRACSQPREPLLEGAAKLAAVIGQCPLEPPAGCAQLLGHALG